MVLFVSCFGVSFCTFSDSDFPGKPQFINKKFWFMGGSNYMGVFAFIFAVLLVLMRASARELLVPFSTPDLIGS